MLNGIQTFSEVASSSPASASQRSINLVQRKSNKRMSLPYSIVPSLILHLILHLFFLIYTLLL